MFATFVSNCVILHTENDIAWCWSFYETLKRQEEKMFLSGKSKTVAIGIIFESVFSEYGNYGSIRDQLSDYMRGQSWDGIDVVKKGKEYLFIISGNRRYGRGVFHCFQDKNGKFKFEKH